MSEFDPKLEHLLTNYFYAISDQHDIRQAFIHKNIWTFEYFTDSCDLENIKKFQQKDGTNVVQAFSNAKLKLVSNVLIYYLFLMEDSQEILEENPVNWVKSDFRKWKSKGCPLATATQNASNADTTQTPTALVVVSRENISNEEVILGNTAEEGMNGVADDDDTVATTTTTTTTTTVFKDIATTITPAFTDIETNGEIILREDVGLNLNDVADATDGNIVSKEEVRNSTVVTTTTTTTTPVFTDIETNGEIVSKEDVGSNLNNVAAATDGEIILKEQVGNSTVVTTTTTTTTTTVFADIETNIEIVSKK